MAFGCLSTFNRDVTTPAWLSFTLCCCEDPADFNVKP